MAATDFTGFTDETIGFLKALRFHNNREWFTQNKALYETALKRPAEAFVGLMAAELETLTGIPQKPKIFRINRDVRFSRDKSPYNAHLHVSWTPVGAGEGAPAFMFGLSPDYLTVGCGVFEFPAAMLETYRKRVAGPAGGKLDAILSALAADGFRIEEPALKRVPAGFPADNPYAKLSLHKGVVAWRDFADTGEATRPDIMRRSLDYLAAMMPLWRFTTDLR